MPVLIEDVQTILTQPAGSRLVIVKIVTLGRRPVRTWLRDLYPALPRRAYCHRTAPQALPHRP